VRTAKIGKKRSRSCRSAQSRAEAEEDESEIQGQFDEIPRVLAETAQIEREQARTLLTHAEIIAAASTSNFFWDFLVL
jgi:hypothetical protein